jgi:hypothetical protein
VQRIPTIYLETTVFSFYHEERRYGEYPTYKAQVRKLFDLIKAGEYEPYSSRFTFREIAREPDPVKREKMTALAAEYGITILDESGEVNRIAWLYVQEGAISPNWETDAVHIAMTTVNGLDFIVSLNFTHIARTWTIEHVRRVNMREGYQGIGIYKPVEVLEIYEDDTGLLKRSKNSQ